MRSGESILWCDRSFSINKLNPTEENVCVTLHFDAKPNRNDFLFQIDRDAMPSIFGLLLK